jgi:hypothetical protein
MKRVILLLFCFLLLKLSSAQSTSGLILRADSAYYDYKNYSVALDLYTKAKLNLKRHDKDYGYVADKIAKTLFYLQQFFKDDNSKSIEHSKQFLELIAKDGAYITPELVSKKYFMYKNIVVGYFGLGQIQNARPFQDSLYRAYKNKELPQGMERYYNFEKFVYNNQNVWGYEAFPELGDKETEGSFSKHIYYIYSRDSAGQDKDQLFTLQTVKIHKLQGTEPDFVLTKRTRTKESEISQSIWSYTFTNPVDYKKLHNAVVDVLKGNAETDTKSVIPLKQ